MTARVEALAAVVASVAGPWVKQVRLGRRSRANVATGVVELAEGPDAAAHAVHEGLHGLLSAVRAPDGPAAALADLDNLFQDALIEAAAEGLPAPGYAAGLRAARAPQAAAVVTALERYPYGPDAPAALATSVFACELFGLRVPAPRGDVARCLAAARPELGRIRALVRMSRNATRVVVLTRPAGACGWSRDDFAPVHRLSASLTAAVVALARRWRLIDDQGGLTCAGRGVLAALDPGGGAEPGPADATPGRPPEAAARRLRYRGQPGPDRVSRVAPDAQALAAQRHLARHVGPVAERLRAALLPAFGGDPEVELRAGPELDDDALLKLALPRLLGAGAVFQDSTAGHEAGDVALTLLIDLSGSMQGDRKLLAVQTALVLGEAFAHLPGLAFEVLAFTTLPGDTTHDHRIAKEFEDSWPAARARVAALALGLGHQNDDAAAVRWAGARLLRRTERKLLVVLSDGRPASGQSELDDEAELARALAEVRGLGVALLGVGIQHDVREHYGRDGVVVACLQDLPRAVADELARRLTGRSLDPRRPRPTRADIALWEELEP